MAALVKILSRPNQLSKSFLSVPLQRISIYRTLFSEEILGTDDFKRIRIFDEDRHGDRKDIFVKKLASAKDDITQLRRHIHDFIKFMYIAKTDDEIALIKDLLRKIVHEKSLSFVQENKLHNEGLLLSTQFQFGPIFVRLLYVLQQSETAMALWEDEELKPMFQSSTCYMLLMDMLYEKGQYQTVVDAFQKLQKARSAKERIPINCQTIVLAALYQINTMESLEQMKSLLKEFKQEDITVSRRSLLFAAALSLKQGQSDLALELSLNAHEPVFKNIKVMALAQSGKLKEALEEIEDVLWADVPLLSRVGVMFSDTIAFVEEAIKTAGSTELITKYESVKHSLQKEGLLSPQTVTHFVTRPILPQRKAYASQTFKSKSRAPVKMRHLFGNSSEVKT